MKRLLFILSLFVSVISFAQNAPIPYNSPWYEFNRKVSVNERFRLPLDTTSLGTGTSRDTSGLIAYKNGKVYFLKNSVWTEVGTGALSGDTLFIQNGPTSSFLNTLARVGVNGDTLFLKSIAVKGTGIITTDAGDSLTFSIPDASASSGGLLTAGTQSIAGVKTFTADTTKLLNGDFTIYKQDVGLGTYNVFFNTPLDGFRFNGPAIFSGQITSSGPIRNGSPNGSWEYNISTNTSNRPIVSSGSRLYRWNEDSARIEVYNGSIWRGLAYNGEAGSGGGGGSGTVTSVATNTGTGITGGPITTTGTLAIDTSIVATKTWATTYGFGGTTAPGGTDTQVQFNDGGAFGGDAGLTYNKTSNTLTTDSVYASNIRIGGIPTVSGWVGLHIRGNSTQSTDFAIRATDNAGGLLFAITNAGVPSFPGIWSSVSSTNLTPIGRTMTWSINNLGSTTGTLHTFTAGSNTTANAGTINLMRLLGNYAPTLSSTANYNGLAIEHTINYTGSAIARGLYINPTLTSAPDYRAIEVANGRSRLRSVELTTAGDKLSIATGSNASIGTATLVGGTVTVNTTAVTANSRIFVTVSSPGGTQGFLSIGTITAGTSFVINSTSATETSVVNWWIIN